MEFEIPGMNLALIIKLYLASSHISFLTNFIINGTFDLPLLMISTVAALSQFTIILFLHHKGPQRTVATTIGYSSNKAIEDLASSGTKFMSKCPKNHFP